MPSATTRGLWTLSGGLAALAILALTRLTRLKTDAAIGISLSVFFALGVVLLFLVGHGPIVTDRVSVNTFAPVLWIEIGDDDPKTRFGEQPSEVEGQRSLAYPRPWVDESQGAHGALATLTSTKPASN